MDAHAQALVSEIVERAGSMSAAARFADVSDRHFQKWHSGHSNPAPLSLEKIRVALDGDSLDSRECRITIYAERAARGESVFG